MRSPSLRDVVAHAHEHDIVYTLVYTDGTCSPALPRWHAMLTITSATQDHDARHRLLQRLDAVTQHAEVVLQATINALLGGER
jgi:hypothetical protein